MFDDMTTIMKEDNTLCVAMDAKLKKKNKKKITQKTTTLVSVSYTILQLITKKNKKCEKTQANCWRIENTTMCFLSRIVKTAIVMRGEYGFGLSLYRRERC